MRQNVHKNSYIHLYPREIELNDTIESSISVSYLDVLMNIDVIGTLTTQLYDRLYLLRRQLAISM